MSNFTLEYMFAGGKYWVLKKDGKEIKSGGKIYIRRWFKIHYGLTLKNIQEKRVTTYQTETLPFGGLR